MVLKNLNSSNRVWIYVVGGYAIAVFHHIQPFYI